MTNEKTAPSLPIDTPKFWALLEAREDGAETLDGAHELERAIVDYIYQWHALASKQVANTDVVRDAWQTIETAPQDGFMLVHEDGAIRAILRVGGEWKQIGYPAIISHPFGDSIVGKDAERMLPSGYRLELRDGCCESPTHWMPLPSPPAPQPESKP